MCGKIKNFVLPKNWCVQLTEKNKSDIKAWIDAPNWTFDIGAYYGMSRNEKRGTLFFSGYTWEEITTEQFYEYVLKIDMDDRFPFKLESKEAKQILSIACSSWESRLAKKWGEDILLKGSTNISETFYKGMRAACDTNQNKLFDEIFGSDTPKPDYKIDEWVVWSADDNHFRFRGNCLFKLF